MSDSSPSVPDSTEPEKIDLTIMDVNIRDRCRHGWLTITCPFCFPEAAVAPKRSVGPQP